MLVRNFTPDLTRSSKERMRSVTVERDGKVILSRTVLVVTRHKLSKQEQCTLRVTRTWNNWGGRRKSVKEVNWSRCRVVGSIKRRQKGKRGT